jgi:hypothetical protein
MESGLTASEWWSFRGSQGQGGGCSEWLSEREEVPMSASNDRTPGSPIPEAEEYALDEYRHLISELARYDLYTPRAINIIGLVITATFTVGVRYEVREIFYIIPFLVLATIQSLLTNNYAYRVREKYVRAVEVLVRGFAQEPPGFYSEQAPRFYHQLPWYGRVLIPFNLYVAYGVIVLVALGTYSGARAWESIGANHEPWILSVYFVALGVGVVLGIISALYGEHKLNHTQLYLRDPRAKVESRGAGAT